MTWVLNMNRMKWVSRDYVLYRTRPSDDFEPVTYVFACQIDAETIGAYEMDAKGPVGCMLRRKLADLEPIQAAKGTV